MYAIRSYYARALPEDATGTGRRPMILIATFVALVFVYSLLSRRLERTVVTAPIVFTSAGLLMALAPEATTALALDRAGFLLVARITSYNVCYTKLLRS